MMNSDISGSRQLKKELDFSEFSVIDLNIHINECITKRE